MGERNDSMNSSKPEYNARSRIAQMKPVVNAATCPTMVIAFVLIRDLMASLDKPSSKSNEYSKRS